MKTKHKKIISIVLLVIITLLIPIGLYTNWVKTTISDQDRFVATFAPLSANPEIQNSLNASANTFIEALDIESALSENLPPALAPISGLLAVSTKVALKNLSEQLIYSEQFSEIWNRMAIGMQSELIKVLEGETDTFLRASDEGLFVTLEPLRERLIERVSEREALNFLVERIAAVELPKFEILNAQQLSFIVFVWDTNKILSVYIWPVIGILAVLAIYLQGSIWRGGIYAGSSVATGAIITLISIYLVNSRLQNQLAEGIYGQTLSEIFNQMTLYLKHSAYWALLVGFLIAILFLIGGYYKNRRATINEGI